MRVATFNLFQFLEPPGHWYERKPDGRSTYSDAEWTAKRGWITDQLAALNADIVGFQEVFSPDALRQLCADAGYVHFATVGTPETLPEDPDVFISPLVAIASRFPLSAQAITVDPALAAFLPVENDFQFSRAPILARIDIPDFGTISTIVAHLKSKRPVMEDLTYPDTTPWHDRVLDTMRRLSRGHVAALLQRGAEAAALYLTVTRILEAERDHPVLILGDLNDDDHSIPLAALKMGDKISEVGGVKSADWPQGTHPHFFRYRMADSWHMAANPSGVPRTGTHKHNGEWSVLDYVLVSNAFDPRNPRGRGMVVDHQVLRTHLESDGVGDRRQSDHGQVVVEVKLRNSF